MAVSESIHPTYLQSCVWFNLRINDHQATNKTNNNQCYANHLSSQRAFRDWNKINYGYDATFKRKRLLIHLQGFKRKRLITKD